jgi:hypothetical protein
MIKSAQGDHMEKIQVLGEKELSSVVGGAAAPPPPTSGLPSGQRMHKPFVITKEL